MLTYLITLVLLPHGKYNVLREQREQSSNSAAGWVTGEVTGKAFQKKQHFIEAMNDGLAKGKEILGP